NTLEAVVAAGLVNRFAGGARFIHEPRHLFRYAAFAGILAPAISASIGVGSLVLAGRVVPEHRFAVWTTWWLGDGAGALVVAPLIVTWLRARPTRWTLPRATEAALLAALTALTALVVFEEILAPIPHH